jgi:mutator protein MutT
MKKIIVVAAIWQDPDGRYFLAQRQEYQSQGGFWEFPGGKVEAGEGEQAALARELAEEIGVGAKVGDFLMETQYEYELGKMIILRAYRIDGVLGIPVALEHQAIAWVSPTELLDYRLAPADVALAQWLLGQAGE